MGKEDCVLQQYISTYLGKRRSWKLGGQEASPISFCHFAEQARAAVGQLLRWKGDMDQDGYLLLKSVYVLTGTDSVSSRLLPRGP